VKRLIVPKSQQLLPYQKEGVLKLIKLRRSLLADQPGLGKTCQAIASSNAFQPQHMVVICPAVVRSTWAAEFKKWDTLGRELQVISNGKQLLLPATRVVIISYDLAASEAWTKLLVAYLSKHSDSMLVCDEMHYCKSWKAKRTQVVVKQLVPNAKYVQLLTGTPITKCVSDLHPLLCAIEPHKWGKHQDFCYKFSYPYPTPFGSGVEFRGTRNEDELKERMAPFTVRRFKQDVLKDLPPKRYANVYLDIDATVAEESLQLVDSALKQLGVEREALEQSDHVATVRQRLGVAKLPAIYKWLDNYLESSPDEQLVIFAYHKAVVHGVEAYLMDKGITTCAITGDTLPYMREKAVTDFQMGLKQVMVGNLIACGTGVTLTASSTVVFCEQDWNPANMLQASDRVHRIGTINPVTIYMLLAKDSLDDHIIEVLEQKMVDIENVVGA